MLKRLRWMATGVAVGVGGSVWAQHKMKSMATRYKPPALAGMAASRARDALQEGRVAMREREAELRRSGRGGRRTSPQ